MARWGMGVVKRHSCGVKGQRSHVTNSSERENAEAFLCSLEDVELKHVNML